MNKHAVNNPFIPHNEEEIAEMMQNLGIRSLEELFRDIPSEFIINKEPDFEGPLSEKEMISRIFSIASKNMSFPKLQLHIGQGAYLRYVPAVVKEILRRSEFLTSYTPYQPEASQGMLTALFEYQSLMAELLDLEIVNSSMYDWSTALAEAGRMAIRLTGKKKILVGRYIFHERLETLNTYIEPMGGSIKEIGYST
jgi:glycine dehydrogenase subunit 1